MIVLAMRGPMPWHLATDDNAELAWVRQLVALRKAHRGLRIGDFRLLEATHLLAFERYTDRSADTIIVLVNPSGEAVEETVLVPDSRLMNMGRLLDLLDPAAEPLAIESALLRIRLPPAGVRVFGLDTAARRGYTPYKRVP